MAQDPYAAGTAQRRLKWWISAIAVAGALSGCFYSPGDCGGNLPAAVRLPSGESSIALLYVEARSTELFPHGAVGRLTSAEGGAGGEGGHGGTAGATNLPPAFDGDVIPSAKLNVDRQSRVVTRSYVDARGRHVVERFRIR
jgi:hypothetical protein